MYINKYIYTFHSKLCGSSCPGCSFDLATSPPILEFFGRDGCVPWRATVFKKHLVMYEYGPNMLANRGSPEHAEK